MGKRSGPASGSGQQGQQACLQVGRYTSNKTHCSPTDPDARISVKPGKARKLNYMSQLCVDTGHHVITDIHAYHSDKKDNQYLQDIVGRLKPRLNQAGLLWRNCVADTGYSPEASGVRTMRFWNRSIYKVLFRPTAPIKVYRRVLNMMRSMTIIYVPRERLFHLKKCSMITEPRPLKRNTEVRHINVGTVR